MSKRIEQRDAARALAASLGMPPPARRRPGRPRSGEETTIPDELCEAFIASHPGGGTLEEIAETLGVTRFAVNTWEMSALAKLRRRAPLAGLEWEPPRHRPCVTDEGEFGDYYASRNLERNALAAAARAAVEEEASRPSPLVARLMDELDAVASRARSVALFLGAVRSWRDPAVCFSNVDPFGTTAVDGRDD